MVGLPLLIYCRGSVGGGGVAHLTQNSVALQKVVFSTVGMGLKVDYFKLRSGKEKPVIGARVY